MLKTILNGIVLFASICEAAAQADDSTQAGKSHYWLLDPTPAAALRPWVTDRGGAIPYTIDAGHFEITLQALTYGHFDRRDSFSTTTTEFWSYGTLFLKAGLANRLDAQVNIVPYETATRRFTIPLFGRGSSTGSGFGDVTARLKLNLWGNDGGPMALSLSGNIKFPTASDNLGNGQFEGGPSLEFAAQLPLEFELRVDTAADFSENGDAAVEDLISLSHQLAGDLRGYCLFNSAVFTSGREWVGQIEAGLKYRLQPNIELYAGSSFGLHGTPFDFLPYFGIAARF